MRVVVVRSPGLDDGGRWAYEWRDGRLSGVLFVDPDGDTVEGLPVAERMGPVPGITAVLLLARHRREHGVWPDRIEYEPDVVPPSTVPVYEPVQVQLPPERGQTLDERAERARRQRGE